MNAFYFNTEGLGQKLFISAYREWIALNIVLIMLITGFSAQ